MTKKISYGRSGIRVIQVLHGVNKPLAFAQFEERAAWEPATVLHPRVVRTLPCLQASLAVKAPHQILMAWNQSQ